MCAGDNLAIDASWLASALTEKIQSINWPKAAQDVALILCSHSGLSGTMQHNWLYSIVIEFLAS
jgi:hypothetical protein